jgi:hypothetical protein
LHFCAHNSAYPRSSHPGNSSLALDAKSVSLGTQCYLHCVA